MKRSELEKYLKKRVKITLFDNSVICGTLCKGDGYFNSDKWYFLSNNFQECSVVFRCSHVKKLEEAHKCSK